MMMMMMLSAEPPERPLDSQFHSYLLALLWVARVGLGWVSSILVFIFLGVKIKRRRWRRSPLNENKNGSLCSPHNQDSFVVLVLGKKWQLHFLRDMI